MYSRTSLIWTALGLEKCVLIRLICTKKKKLFYVQWNLSQLVCTVNFRNRNVSLLNVSCLIFWLAILEKMASGQLLCLALILYVCVRVCLHILSPYHTHTHTQTHAYAHTHTHTVTHTHNTKTDLSDDSYSFL